MQEIAQQVYIETAYPGVTLGAINWQHGLILIDSPFRAEDIRSWRTTLLNLGGGVDRLLINLDAHIDRTMGTRTMECTVLGHEDMAQLFRNHPAVLKSQNSETGADWEAFSGLGSVRWSPPEISFSHCMRLNYGDSSLVLEHRPGPGVGAIWVVLPVEKVVFVGDAITPRQPPYLAAADIQAWVENLQVLLSDEYQGYQIISGRSGLVGLADVSEQIQRLKFIQSQMDQMASGKNAGDDPALLVNNLLAEYDFNEDQRSVFERRLRWGVTQYYAHHYHPVDNSEDEG